MHSTVAAIAPETRQRSAIGYQHLYDDRPSYPSHPLVPAPWVEYGTGVGSIASSVEDMALYLRMLLNQGQAEGIRLLSEHTFNLMTQRAINNAWHESLFYGYGLIVYEVDGHTCIGHGGETTGFNAMLVADIDDGLGVVVLMNGSGEPAYITQFALQLLQAALYNQELPPPPTLSRSYQVDDYVGVYHAGKRQFELVSQEQTLVLHYKGEVIALTCRGKDTFYVEHPDFDLFLLTFGREDGRVVEAFHGADWYVNQHYTGALAFDYPQEWLAYPGHYRSHNPWFSNFRIVLRKGKLLLVYPKGGEAVLMPVGDRASASTEGDRTFSIGENNQSPERLHFDTVVASQALRATLSGCDYYRTVK